MNLNELNTSFQEQHQTSPKNLQNRPPLEHFPLHTASKLTCQVIEMIKRIC